MLDENRGFGISYVPGWFLEGTREVISIKKYSKSAQKYSKTQKTDIWKIWENYRFLGGFFVEIAPKLLKMYKKLHFTLKQRRFVQYL